MYPLSLCEAGQCNIHGSRGHGSISKLSSSIEWTAGVGKCHPLPCTGWPRAFLETVWWLVLAYR